MAVRITEDFVPVEDPTVFSAAFHTGGHCFASVTMDMVRDIINKEANARAAAAGHRPISKFHDPQRVLDLMEWWNDLPSTERAMPWFKTSHSTYNHIVEMKNLCHVCHNKLPNVQVAAPAPAPAPLRVVCQCPAAGTELYQQVAAIVRRDFERFDSMSFYYYTALDNHSDLQGKLKALEQRSSSPAWIKALKCRTRSVLEQVFG
jgi:hypothetical protein